MTLAYNNFDLFQMYKVNSYWNIDQISTLISFKHGELVLFDYDLIETPSSTNIDQEWCEFLNNTNKFENCMKLNCIPPPVKSPLGGRNGLCYMVYFSMVTVAMLMN